MISLPARRALHLASFGLAAATLSACYVVPMQPGPAMVVPAGAPAPAPVVPVGMNARLYPANELATPYGMVSATVSNDLNGRGHFLAQIAGESFTGEATRLAGSQREGVANGTGQPRQLPRLPLHHELAHDGDGPVPDVQRRPVLHARRRLADRA
jgi:hypothetical protein